MNSLLVVSAVCKKIHEAFPEIPIYREKIQSDFETPSFFVWCESFDTSPLQRKNYEITQHIVVSFFPSNNEFNKYAILNEVGLHLLSTLYSINVEYSSGSKPLLAFNPTFQIVDENHLSWSCTFTLSSNLDCSNTHKFNGSLTTNVQEK